MEKAYKYRIYPNKEQIEMIQKTFGCCRYVYNYFLNKQAIAISRKEKPMKYTECASQLVFLKAEHEWLKEIDSIALQSSVKHLDTAFKNFNRKRKIKGYVQYTKKTRKRAKRQQRELTLFDQQDFPKFKSKKHNKKSYQTKCVNHNIVYWGRYIKLPKLGYVKTRNRLEPQGRILNATISQTPDRKYYVSLCCTDVETTLLPHTNRSAGFDLGLSDFAVSSDNIKYAYPNFLDKSLAKLQRLNRLLSRKTIGSANFKKAQLKVAKMYQKITNRRNDFLNKLSLELVKAYDIICLEDLDIKGMLKDKDRSRSISDVSWYRFTSMLTYKAEWYGKKVIKISRYFASSQICSKCGYKNPEVKDLKVRTWTCPCCNSFWERDYNASINIHVEGLKLLDS